MIVRRLEVGSAGESRCWGVDARVIVADEIVHIVT
jgi:hypothetical protein